VYLEDYFGLKGKVALVTGGSRGIGQVIARDLAKAGAKIAIFSRTKATETVKMIEEIGGQVCSYIVDIRDEDSVKNGIESIIQNFGSLDILFNNAGITIHKPFIETSIQEWKDVTETNLIGEIIVAKAVGKVMIEKGIHGSIINMASMSGSIVNIPQTQTVYNVTKAAVIHLTKCLAIEFAKYNIRVNSLSPGYISTAMSVNVSKELNDEWMKLIPLHRMGFPEELSGAIIFLACDSASYITGTDIIIDGGYTCL